MGWWLKDRLSSRQSQKFMLVVLVNNNERVELERKILAAALAQSYERRDNVGVKLAPSQILQLLKTDQKPSNGKNQRAAQRAEQLARSQAAAAAPAYQPPVESRSYLILRRRPSVESYQAEKPAR